MTYPADALATRVTGAVVVRAVTDASGRVIEAEPLSGPPVLRPSVVANIKQWILSPGARSEPMVYLFEIDYALCNDDSRSLFRLVYPNLAVITACSSPGRSHVPVRYDELPIASHGKTPNYPMIAQNAQVKGIVVLELSFDANGAVTPRALNDLPLLTQTAVEHARTFRGDGKEPYRGIFIYEFALDNKDCRDDRHTVFSRVTADYMRLSGCLPLIQP